VMLWEMLSQYVDYVSKSTKEFQASLLIRMFMNHVPSVLKGETVMKFVCSVPECRRKYEMKTGVDRLIVQNEQRIELICPKCKYKSFENMLKKYKKMGVKDES